MIKKIAFENVVHTAQSSEPIQIWTRRDSKGSLRLTSPKLARGLSPVWDSSSESFLLSTHWLQREQPSGCTLFQKLFELLLFWVWPIKRMMKYLLTKNIKHKQQTVHSLTLVLGFSCFELLVFWAPCAKPGLICLSLLVYRPPFGASVDAAVDVEPSVLAEGREGRRGFFPSQWQITV